MVDTCLVFLPRNCRITFQISITVKKNDIVSDNEQVVSQNFVNDIVFAFAKKKNTFNILLEYSYQQLGMKYLITIVYIELRKIMASTIFCLTNQSPIPLNSIYLAIGHSECQESVNFEIEHASKDDAVLSVRDPNIVAMVDREETPRQAFSSMEYDHFKLEFLKHFQSSINEAS